MCNICNQHSHGFDSEIQRIDLDGYIQHIGSVFGSNNNEICAIAVISLVIVLDAILVSTFLVAIFVIALSFILVSDQIIISAVMSLVL